MLTLKCCLKTTGFDELVQILLMMQSRVASGCSTGHAAAAEGISPVHVGSVSKLQMVPVYLVWYVRVCLSWL